MEYTLEEILRLGENLYLNSLKDELESAHYGDYAVIDVETKRYTVAPRKLAAIEEAKQKFGNKLFYTVKIGSLDKPTVNYRHQLQHAWNI